MVETAAGAEGSVADDGESVAVVLARGTGHRHLRDQLLQRLLQLKPTKLSFIKLKKKTNLLDT